jgi:hypothetical protein
MARHFFPTANAAFALYCLNFANGLETIGTQVGISTQQTAVFGNKYQEFNNFLAVCGDGATRTPVKLVLLREAKASLIAELRKLAGIIQKHPGTSDAMRQQLGLTIAKRPTPSPIPGMPYVKVVSTDGRRVKLCIQQSQTTKRKPKGVLGANVMVAYATSAPQGAAGWEFVEGTGRTTLTVTLDGVPEACTAWLTAFWFNGRKETGVAATPVPVTLPAINAMPQAMKLGKAA